MIGFLVLLLTAWLAPEQPSDIALFLGRFHPMLLHLPIGILLVALVFEVLARQTRFAAWHGVTPVLWLLGAWSAIAAALAGVLLATGGGYDADLVFWHKRLGIGLALAASLLYVVKTWPATRPALRRALVPGLIGIVLLLAVGSHLGGTLTHGEGYLTRYMPDPLRAVAGLPPKAELGMPRIDNLDEAQVYATFVQPVLTDKCGSCHGPGKQKGGLQLDSFDALLDGGDDGPVVRAGQSDESALVHRVLLPLEHDDHMPPAGKPQLTAAEFELLRWWIDLGASSGLTLAEAKPTPAVQTIFDGLGLAERPRGIFALDVPPPDTAALHTLRAFDVVAQPLAEDVPFLDIAFTNVPDSLIGPALRALEPVAEQVAWLDVSRTPVTDGDLTVLAHLPHLTRLSLNQTGVTDVGLAALAHLEHLDYLNLYGTAVSDAGLDTLTALPNLRTLYLWQTHVTPDAVQRLATTHPKLDVNLGLTPTVRESIEPKALP